MAICLLKQIIIVKEKDDRIENTQNLNQKYIFKLRMSAEISNLYESELLANFHLDSEIHNKFEENKKSELNSMYDIILKKAVNEFHNIFQNRLYSNTDELIELAHNVKQSVQTFSNFYLPECLKMSINLCEKLFKEKYLFQ